MSCPPTSWPRQIDITRQGGHTKLRCPVFPEQPGYVGNAIISNPAVDARPISSTSRFVEIECHCLSLAGSAQYVMVRVSISMARATMRITSPAIRMRSIIAPAFSHNSSRKLTPAMQPLRKPLQIYSSKSNQPIYKRTIAPQPQTRFLRNRKFGNMFQHVFKL